MQQPTPPRVRITPRPDGVEGVCVYEACDPGGQRVPGPRVVIVGRQHGNEPVGAEVIGRLAACVSEHLVAGTLVTVVANLEAAALDVRHTPDGVDMNRLWDADRLVALAAADPDTLCSEERRVREIFPFVQHADGVFDLHSTSRPSPAHLLFRDDLRHAALAARLGVSRMVTGVHENAVLDGGLCADVGLRPGEPSDWVGFTLEAGQHLNPDNVQRAWSVVVRFLVEMGIWQDAQERYEPVPYEVYDIIDRFLQSPGGASSYRFVGYEGGEAGGGRQGPPRFLESFDAIEADEILLRRDDGEVVRAEAPFTMLMPAPTAGPGEDLFYITQRRHAALQSRPADSHTARVEAFAIERMMDLLAWDDAQRGNTRVSVTSRRTLDLCAELVARTARLPVGHPHRRITVVGRGDWGGDESEQRASRRWHAALRQAVEDGVPVARVQLLRGAAIGWLGRVFEHIATTPGSTLHVSGRQPHTVSVVLVGDPEQALSTGEFRHVGVAMLVEAATVEPDGDDVRTRVARAGLFGARPELLRAAAGLVRSLRREHEHQLQGGELALLARHLGPDGTLLEAPDAAPLVTLQLQRWQRSLRKVVTRPATLEAGTLGTWLARVMVGTGILDAHALRAWLVRPHEGGWHIDPRRIEVLPDPGLLTAQPMLLPPPVLDARQVDADNIDRWMGWKRYLRDVQGMPGTRGRDLEIAFAPAMIQNTVAGWMDDARALARNEPGKWLVAIAGDGLSPRRDRAAEGWNVLWAHRQVMLDKHLRYLRVQHAQGAHVAWLKDFVQTIGQRDAQAAPMAMCWETEHGGSVNIMLVAHHEGEGEPDPWSLDDWTIERCSVLVSDSAGAQDYQVALFTARDDQGIVNQELVHFGRMHCERLLKQSSWRFQGRGGALAQHALENAARQLVADQVASVTELRHELRDVPEAARGEWVARRLGLLDREISQRVAEAVTEGHPVPDAARRIWKDLTPWPGPLWREMGRLD